MIVFTLALMVLAVAIIVGLAGLFRPQSEPTVYSDPKTAHRYVLGARRYQAMSNLK